MEIVKKTRDIDREGRRGLCYLDDFGLASPFCDDPLAQVNHLVPFPWTRISGSVGRILYHDSSKGSSYYQCMTQIPRIWLYSNVDPKK